MAKIDTDCKRRIWKIKPKLFKMCKPWLSPFKATKMRVTLLFLLLLLFFSFSEVQKCHDWLKQCLYVVNNMKTFSLTLKKYHWLLSLDTLFLWWIDNMILYWCIALCLLNRLKSRKNRSNFSSHSAPHWTCFLNNTANIESFLSCW